MRARSYYHKKVKKSGKIEDWKAFKRVRNQLKSMIRKAKREYFEELSMESVNNPTKAWQEVNRILGGKGRCEIQILKIDGGVITSKQEMVEEFARFFSSIVGVMGKMSEDAGDAESEVEVESTFRFKEIEEGDVLKALLHLNPNKACGTDGISANVLRMVAPGICDSLTVIFNACLKEGRNPEEWKSANSTPVHKGGNVDVTSNYRPVSMLPVVVKVLERLIHQQLYDYLQENKILDPAQFGF